MRTIDGNIFDIEHGIIAHVVNPDGIMGSGLAWTMSSKWPQILKPYMDACQQHWDVGWLPTQCSGWLEKCEINSKLTVISMFAQVSLTTPSPRLRYLELACCLRELRGYSGDRPVYVPFNMGCGLAGGDWNIVSALLAETDFIVVKLP